MTVPVDTRNLNERGLGGNMAKRVDKSTYATVAIGWVHERVHEGVHWYCNEGYGPLSPVEANSINHPIFLTPAAPQVVHFSMSAHSTSIIRVRFFEDVSPVEPVADEVPFFNNRRPTSNTIQTTRWNSLNVNTVASVVLATATIGTATIPGSLAWWQGDTRLLLKPSIYYMVVFDNFENGSYLNLEMNLLETAEIL